MTAEHYLWGALTLAAGWIAKDLIGPLLRRRLERADDADRTHFAAVIQRVDSSQADLAVRLREDREAAGRHFEGLWNAAKELERRLSRIEVHHQHNHPGQS